ncbi:MAG: RluA family pseudouridine synthase [Patescibacteria group bacterium]|nr:RluA family pseudouridine synthase [Patescibacteria group bacterium]
MEIIFENQDLAVLNKPVNTLTHPTSAGEKNTVVNFIIEKWPEVKKYTWEDKNRIGIVHRLDKNTSGLLAIAKNPTTQMFLQCQFQNHTIDKRYLTLVLGQTEKNGKIVADIGRDPKTKDKQKVMPLTFSWTKGKTRSAETHYQLIKYLHLTPYTLSLLEVKILTGRMHQIRVHLKYIDHPIIGDQIYNTKESKKISNQLGLKHQFLHSYKLTFRLPSGETKTFTSKLPQALKDVIDGLTKP